MNKIENEYLLQDLLEVSVANIYMFDEKSGLEYYSGTLSTHELNQTADSEEIKGGQANDVIATIEKSKTLELKISDVVARQDIQALKFGGKIKEVSSDIVDAMHMPKNYTISGLAESLTITLDQTPKAGEVISVYNNKTKKKITDEKAVVSGKTVTITEEGLQAGDTVFVGGFKYQAKATDKYAEISTDSSAPVLYAVVEVNLFDTDMNVVAKKQYLFPRTKMDSSVTLSGQSEKTANNDETTIKILKDPSLNYLGRIVYVYPEAV